MAHYEQLFLRENLNIYRVRSLTKIEGKFDDKFGEEYLKFTKDNTKAAIIRSSNFVISDTDNHNCSAGRIGILFISEFEVTLTVSGDG